MATTREELHQLIDQLPEADLPAARRAIERVARRPSLTEVLANAPIDDEPLSPEEIAAIAEGMRAIDEGRVVSDAEVARRLGLPPLTADPDD